MSRIICHASLLKRDDCRLKGLSMSHKTCTNCEMYCVEDIMHIITQCPFYYNDQVTMYKEVARKCPNVHNEIVKDNINAPFYLLGKKVPSCSDEELLCFWRITGCAITRMYRKALANKTGVG